MNREEANDELVKMLGFLVAERPNQRFSQILRNYGFISETRGDSSGTLSSWNNEFNAEPDYIVERVRLKMEGSRLSKKYNILFGKKMTEITATFIDSMGSDVTVVNAARVSFGKTIETLKDSDIKLINYLAKNKHLTPFEHCSLSVKIKCPMYIRSQIHRHRTFSYNEISRRYTSENIEFYLPKARKQHKNSKQCSDGDMSESEIERSNKDLEVFHSAAMELYNKKIDGGEAREIARGVLPQNAMTEFWMTGNLRNWIHFLGLRLDSHAQLEVQLIAQPILKMIESRWPVASKALIKHTLEGHNQ